jgi:hypothetical protein
MPHDMDTLLQRSTAGPATGRLLPAHARSCLLPAFTIAGAMAVLIRE